MTNKDEETKEEFCSACVAGVSALVGAGISGSSTSTKVNKKYKKIIFYSGIAISIVSIIILVYLLKYCEKCK